MKLTIFYPQGFLNCKNFRSVILLHLSEHLILYYLIEALQLSPLSKHSASVVFDFTYFNFSLGNLNKTLNQKLIKSLETFIEQPSVLKKYFLKEKNKMENEFYLKEIDNEFQIKKLIFASIVDSNVIEYNLEKSVKILRQISWQEAKEFIKSNFSFKKFLIIKKDNNYVELFKYPEDKLEFSEIKLKYDFKKLNRSFPFLLICLYYLEPLPELIFFERILRKSIRDLLLENLSQELCIYSYIEKNYISFQQLFNVFIIPHYNKQKLKKAIIKAKEEHFYINKSKFEELKNEFLDVATEKYFDIFNPYILNKIFTQEIKKFELKQHREKILTHIKALNYNQFIEFLEKLDFIFNI